MTRLHSLPFIIFASLSFVSFIDAAPRHKSPKRIVRNANQLQQHPEEDEELKIVLTNFACAVNHFVNIVTNPNNTQNVAQGIGGILCNIGNVIAQAIKSHKISELDALECEQEINRSILMLKITEK